MTERAGRTRVEFRVRYAETDQMGVVYHANYLAWCEIGRTELIRRRWDSYARLEREGVLLAVADASLRYHAPARYDEMVAVEAWVEEVRSRAVTFGYSISRAEGEMKGERLVSARTTLVAIGRDNRPKRLPPELVESLRDE